MGTVGEILRRNAEFVKKAGVGSYIVTGSSDKNSLRLLGGAHGNHRPRLHHTKKFLKIGISKLPTVKNL
jgi:hypothetical protein